MFIGVGVYRQRWPKTNTRTNIADIRIEKVKPRQAKSGFIQFELREKENKKTTNANTNMQSFDLEAILESMWQHRTVSNKLNEVEWMKKK